MTSNQIPGISARYGNEVFPEASWGLGWDVQGNKKTRNYPTLHSAETFNHDGLGGSRLCIDPTNDLVVVYLHVRLREDDEGSLDLFVNTVVSAIVD